MSKSKKHRTNIELNEKTVQLLKEASNNELFEGRYQRLVRYILDKVMKDKNLLKEVLK